MGDRALIRFHNSKEIGPVVYLHWGGSGVADLLRRVRELMADRPGDPEYATARCIGMAHEQIPGNLSLGVWSEASEYQKERTRMTTRETLDYDAERLHYPHSHGDAGVFLVDTQTWNVECFGGYGFGEREDGWSGPPVVVPIPDVGAL